MNLYQIDAEIKQLLSTELNEDGSIDETISGRLEDLMKAEKSKIIGCGHWIAKKQRDIAQAKEQANNLLAECKKEENKIVNLKKLVVNALDTWNDGKIEDGLFKMSTRKGGVSTFIIDESKIPDNFKIEKTVISIDKTAIKDTIKSGGIVDGAELKEGQRGLTIKGE